LGPDRSVSDEPVTSRHGSVEMSTLAGQLLTKKIVVGFNPAARSYLFNVGFTSLRSSILGQLWKKATAYMDHWDACYNNKTFPLAFTDAGVQAAKAHELRLEPK
jgi:hypothetical protein